MSESYTDRGYLERQYGDAERLAVRLEAHARYSENRGHYVDWLLGFLEPRPDILLLDVGCGSGTQHLRLRQQRMRIIGVDLSRGMLRDALRQTREQGLSVHLCAGDAQRLPIADTSVDRAMANHLLYHVPDPGQALREMRRVLRPGGRVVIGANAADSSRRLIALHDEAARALGYRPLPPLYEQFHLGHLPLVQEVFPSAKLKLRNDSFVFPDVDSALRYYTSALVDHIAPLPPDGSHRAALAQRLAPELRKIVESEGAFRVPKNAGAFVAEV